MRLLLPALLCLLLTARWEPPQPPAPKPTAGVCVPPCAVVPAPQPAAPAPVDTSLLDVIPPKPPARVDAPMVPERAVELIIAFEVGSPEVYTRKYQRPIWPGAASGVTVGIGYDLGHRRASVIALDWEDHPHAVRMQTAAGITGPLAREQARQLADIVVEWGLAREVFDQTCLIEHYRIARRIFVPERFDALPPNAQGALTSLVFNRGGSLTGPSRAEMREIRDTCVPAGDVQCIAAQLRAMMRLWRGKDIERGMERRRNAEAALAVAA